jgi:hypothetical protein
MLSGSILPPWDFCAAVGAPNFHESFENRFHSPVEPVVVSLWQIQSPATTRFAQTRGYGACFIAKVQPVV